MVDHAEPESAAGAALSVAVRRAIAGLLFGIAPLDAVSYAAAACVLAVVVAAAAAFPLRRALSVDAAVSKSSPPALGRP